MRQSPSAPPQALAWRLEAFALDIITALLRLLPVDAASALGGGAMKAIGPLSKAHRIAGLNLTLAFPEMGESERRRILNAQWENFGRYIIELLMMDRLTPASGRIEVVGAERLAAVAAGKTANVFVSGHFSNMEIMPAVILAAGIDCVVTGRAVNNPYVNARIIESRRRYGVTVFAPKGSEGTRELLAALKVGRSVALMNDQKNNRGVAAPFFGHLCHTASGPTKLALLGSGVLQPMSVQRTKGARFRVVVHEPIVLERTGDRASDVAAGVRQINAFVEARVRERPEEWWWVHRRWADSVYAAMEA
jgi:KDO2-lipid IV(A) lauroyltransferase